MPQDDALLKAVETLTLQLRVFHKDFKESIYYLVNTLNRNNDTENTATTSQMDLFPTQAPSLMRSEPFKFSSDEKEKETEFDAKVTLCIDKVAAQWKKLVKTKVADLDVLRCH